MRKTIAQGVYLLLTELITVYLVVCPAYAFQVSSSSTGYVRVATQAAQLAYVAANRASLISTVASAAVVASPVSVAVRLVTGPIGWAALGLTVALTLAQMYYSPAELAAVKTAAAPVSTHSFTYTYLGQTYTVSSWTSTTAIPQCASGIGYFFPGTTFGPPSPSPGMFSTPFGGWWCFPAGSQATTSAPTQQQIADYLTTLPAGNTSSPESHTTPVGQGVTPTPADTVTTNPVTPSQVAPTVKPASQVLPTDAVIDPNAPAPAGPQPPVPSSQTTTTTTTTTTNPDGSTTKQEADTATVSCSAGNHDQRSFGSVLQDHMNLWQSSGLLSALNVLKTLTWPSTIPTYALSSSMFGSFTLDFSAWSGLLTALRSLLIAIASFVAYRIIFVGSP